MSNLVAVDVNIDLDTDFDTSCIMVSLVGAVRDVELLLSGLLSSFDPLRGHLGWVMVLDDGMDGAAALVLEAADVNDDCDDDKHDDKEDDQASD